MLSPLRALLGGFLAPTPIDAACPRCGWPLRVLVAPSAQVTISACETGCQLDGEERRSVVRQARQEHREWDAW